MASPTPLSNITAADIQEALKNPKPQFFEYKPGLVVDNATYGRVRTTVCYADRREEKLDQMRQYYAQNKDFMNNQEATYMQQQMAKLQSSISPGEPVASSGLTDAQKAYDQEQAENWKDIEEMEDDPIYGASRGAGLNKKHAHAVSVLVKGLGDAKDFKSKPAELKEKIADKPPFKMSPYE